MQSIQRNVRLTGYGLALLCAGLVVGGCGLVGKHGNLATGNQDQAAGKYRAAYIEAKKVLQRNDKDGKAWLLLGRATLMLGNPKTALSDLGNAKANGVPGADWAVPMGRALLATQQYGKLLATLPADNAFDTKVKARVAVLRGAAQLGLKHFEPARKSYQSALAVNPKDPGALVGLARLAAIAKDTGAANRYVQQALTAAPGDPRVWVAKADLAFNQRDFAAAETSYQKALDVKHADWLPQERFYALSRLANAQAQQNQLDKALANIQTLEKMAPQQPYPHYLNAVVLYRQGHLNDAVDQLQQVLKTSANNLQAQFLMGAINYAQGNYGQAQMYLSNVLGMDPQNIPAQKLLALTFYAEGRSRRAVDTLRPAVSGTPTDAELLATLQHAAAAGAGKPGKLAATGATSPATGESSAPSTPLQRAGRALVSGNASDAIRLLKEMPTGDASAEAKRTTLLVASYARAGKSNKAVEVAAAYAAKHPKNSGAHVLYGTALVTAGQHSQARAQYSRALKLDPKNIAALLSLGSLDTLEGHYQHATQRYEAALKADPKNATVMTSLGHLAAIRGDRAGAAKWLKRAIDAAPKAVAPYLELVVLQSRSRQFQDAVATAKRLVSAVPNDPVALNALGATELDAGHYADALKPLQQAVHSAPKVALYRTNLARAQILNKDPKGAAKNLDAAIEADPHQLTAVTLRAFMKLHDHDLPGALALAQALQNQTQPAATKAAGYALEGDLYMVDKSYDKAATAYQQGLKVRYDRPLVIKRFQALAAGGAKHPARVLRDWLAKHPTDAAARLVLAQYYLGRADDRKAATEYQHVLKAYPSNVDALNNLAWIYTKQHDPNALKLAGQAHKLAPTSPGVADTYGWALISANQPKAALPLLEQAAKAAPKVPTIQYHLAVAQARTGDHASARATLEALRKSGVSFQGKAAAEKLYRQLGGG